MKVQEFSGDLLKDHFQEKIIIFSSTSFMFVKDAENMTSFIILQIDQTTTCQIIESPPINFTLPPKEIKLLKRLLGSQGRTTCQPNQLEILYHIVLTKS